ncbi:MAG: DUF4340 domain-containing protein [Deltaproteobacteria bacterium]|nr:DUF4340 domain-containing protein [Deltaproteobacteria bacterium]MBW2085266.1 DUF4340 domain-containing protein [Deltaproteobacteria bacterium]
MKPRQLIVYLVIFIILGVFYFMYEVKLKDKEAEFEEAQARLFTLDDEEITGFKLINRDMEIYLVRRGEDEWWITEPIETPALAWAAKSVIDRFLGEKKERIFKKPVQDMTEFGLEKPAQALTFLADSKALAPTLYVGGKNPLAEYYYARLGRTSEVFTIPAYLQQTLDKTLYDLRNKDLVIFDRTKIDGLRLLIPAEGELKKVGPQKWDIIKPNLGQADNVKIEKLFRLGIKGEIKEFVSAQADNDKYGFNNPLVKVQALSRGKLIAEIVVGQAKKKAVTDEKKQDRSEIEGYWAKNSERPDEVLLIDAESFEVLKQTPFDIKDKHLLVFNRHAVQFIEVSGPKQTLKAKKVEGHWKVSEPKEAQTEEHHIVSFLMDLEDLEYKRLLDSTQETLKKYGLDKPDFKIKLRGAEKPLAELILSTRPASGKLLAVRAGTDPVVLVNSDFLEKLLPDFKPPAASFKEESNTGKR